MKRAMNLCLHPLALLATVLVTLAAPVPASAGIQQAFLVQNSGWMEPFYADPASQLKPLVAAVAGAAAEPDDRIITLAFSQSHAEHHSPQLLGEGNAASVAGLLAPLTLARKGSGPALADTDFQEAIRGTITGPLHGQSGIIWIFTNNRNSPGNDPATAARNRDFYRLLHLEPSITKTVVFPLKMPLQGKLYSARGLMVYALAYGEPAAAALTRILANGRLSSVLTRPPARLKPVNQDALRIVPEALLDSPNMHASLGSDQRTLILDVEAASLVPTVHLKASLQNQFYPYAISNASVSAQLHAPGGVQQAIRVSPDRVASLAPGAHQAVDVQFQLPLEQVPSAWSAKALGAMGKRLQLPMLVTLDLSGQQLALPAEFLAEMQQLFPGDPLAEALVPPSSVRSSRAQVPLLVRVQYPLAPVLVVVAGVLALFGALATLLILAGRSSRYPVQVDGYRRQLMLKAFSSQSVLNDQGEIIGEIRRGLGAPRIVQVADGHTLQLL